MSDFNQFKEKAGIFAASTARKAKDLAVLAANKTKQLSRVAKLNMDISSQKETIKNAYTEIGKLYYETHGQSPEGFFVQLCQEIDIANEAIAGMEAEIAELKATVEETDAPCEAEDADFETVVDESAADIEIEIEVEREPEVPAEPVPPAEPEAPAESVPPAEPEAPAEPAAPEAEAE